MYVTNYLVFGYKFVLCWLQDCLEITSVNGLKILMSYHICAARNWQIKHCRILLMVHSSLYSLYLHARPLTHIKTIWPLDVLSPFGEANDLLHKWNLHILFDNTMFRQMSIYPGTRVHLYFHVMFLLKIFSFRISWTSVNNENR